MSVRRVRLAAGVATLALTAAGGATSVHAATSTDQAVTTEPASSTVADADTTLFDPSVLHEITVRFDQTAYLGMIDTYVETGEKEWIEATVTIDGVVYEQAGLRLKGNSSLAGLGGHGPGGGMGGREGGAGAGVTAEQPESLPWLIRLDEFVEDREHQGYEDIVIRSNGSATSLNEAVALDLLEEAGLASQQAVMTAFSVNGGDPVLRLAIEHPDDDAWQETAFDGDGALYKAESTGDWSYHGADPAAYDEIWDQEGGSDVADLTPLIEFLQFLEESDDATFAAELPERLDVDSFATYLAMMDLLANWDDIDGPGNNAYLWYDVASGQFTVVPWDMNLAFSQGGFGGGGPGLMGGAPGGFPTDGSLPEGFPTDGSLPDDFQPPSGGPGGDIVGGPGGGMFGRSNVLVERFHANAEFEALYQQKLTELPAALFDGGLAEQVLATWVATLTDQASGLVDAATIDEEAQAISRQFDAA